MSIAGEAEAVLGDRRPEQVAAELLEPHAVVRRHGVLYRHAERTKSELYLDLLPLITRGAIELPPDLELLRQLRLLERRRGAQGKDVVDHPHGAYHHDDRANAVALALAALGSQAVSEVRVEAFPIGTPSWEAMERRLDARPGGWEDSRGLCELVDDGFFDGRRFDW